jgi:hypothetical protein
MVFYLVTQQNGLLRLFSFSCWRKYIITISKEEYESDMINTLLEENIILISITEVALKNTESQ